MELTVFGGRMQGWDGFLKLAIEIHDIPPKKKLLYLEPPGALSPQFEFLLITYLYAIYSNSSNLVLM